MRTLTTLTLFFCLCLVATGQTTTGSITGAVLDPSGASIVKAAVSLVNEQRGATLTATTDDVGRFSFVPVPPGTYGLMIKAPGFKALDRKGIQLVAGDRLTLGNLTLEVGGVEQTVEVTAAAVLLKTESAERSDSIIGKQLQNVAVNARTYLSLTALLPGVVNNNDYKTPGHGGLGGINANGARGNQNQLTLNGISNVDTGNNGDQLATISLDAVEEFKMLTGVYQAEYGRSAGAQIIVVSKSGSNQWHGSGYWFHRHEGLNANNWKNNRDGAQRSKFRSNIPGYTIGGPVYIPGKFNKNKDKLFVFWSQEYQRMLRPQGRRDIRVPTELERQGDFSQTRDRDGNLFPYVRDYTLNAPCDSKNVAGCFADGGVLGRVPKGRLFGPGLAILNMYPKPNVSRTGLNYNYSSQISDSYPRREDLIRVDYNVTSALRLFGHYINNNDGYTSNYGSFVLGANVPIVPILDARPGRSAAGGLTWIINPTTTNEATVGYGHNQINIDPINDGLKKSSLGLSNLPILYPKAVQNDFPPSFNFGGRLGSTPTFGTNNAPFFNYNTTFDFINNFSKVHGSHMLKAGIFLQKSLKDQTSFANANGNYSFGETNTNPYDSGTSYSNAALGVYNSFTQAGGYFTGMYRYWNTEWYVQDTWKVNRRLTLDYGLRMALYQPQFDKGLQTSTFLPETFNPAKASVLYRPVKNSAGQAAALNPLTGQLEPSYLIGKLVSSTANLTNGVAQAGKGVNQYLMQYRGVHFGPRFGFAYDVTGHQNLVVRGGAGIFYDRFQGNEVFDMLTNPPTTVQPTLQYGLMKDINPANLILAPVNLQAFSYEGKVPTVYNYTLGIQSKLPARLVLDTAYVGSLSRHQLQRINLNAIPYEATFQPQNQDPTKNASQLGSGALNRDFLRPYQGFGDIALHQMGGTANYNSLQAGLNRRVNSGLFLQASYTWSKTMGTVGGDGDYIRIDRFTRYANYGPLGFDRRHMLAVNFVYDIPGIGKKLGWNAAVKGVTDGWQLSGIYRAQSGGPGGVGFSIPGIGNENLTGSYTEGTRILVKGDPKSGVTGSPYNRLNPNVFAPPYVGSRGLDSPRIMQYGPGINNWDLSLQKQFKVAERVALQLRIDTFNSFNHTQFSGLNSGINYRSLADPTITNLPFKADGTVNNINGFGTVSGARDGRFVQTVIRIQF